MSGAHDPLIENGHIHEHPIQIHILLIVRPYQVVKGVSRYRKHRHAIAFGVIQTIQ